MALSRSGNEVDDASPDADDSERTFIGAVRVDGSVPEGFLMKDMNRCRQSSSGTSASKYVCTNRVN